jgi:hypothetical protein
LFSGKALTFPCHRDGSVDIDALTDLSRNNYLAARALVGREYACPVVLPVLH